MLKRTGLYYRKGLTAIGGFGIDVLLVGTILALAVTILVYNANCCVTSDYFMTMSSASIYSGTASNSSSRGMAVFTISINNPGSPTAITMIEIIGSALRSIPEVFQCASKASCTLFYRASLPGGVVSSFDTDTTAFYLSSALIPNMAYNYVINFLNGDSISGFLIAQNSTFLPKEAQLLPTRQHRVILPLISILHLAPIRYIILPLDSTNLG